MHIRSMLLTIVYFLFLTPYLLVMPTYAEDLDPTFGNDGRLVAELGNISDKAHAVVVQPDGKILIAGSSSNSSNYDFVLLRLNDDGSNDTSFNYDGTVTTAVGGDDDEILALGLLADGRIVAAGYTDNGVDRDFALVRYLQDGTLDRSFGQEGIAVTPVGNSHDEITALLVEEDGSVIVAGNADGTNGNILVCGRFLASGELDRAFGDQGLSFTDISSEGVAQSLAARADGGFVVSGSYVDENTHAMMLVGFSADGNLDTAFGSSGIAIAALEESSEGHGVLVDQDGSIFVAGAVGDGGARDAALFYFTSQGQTMQSFGVQGVKITQVGPEDDVLYNVAGTEGNLAASGFTSTNGYREFLVIRYSEGGEQYITEAVGRAESEEGLFRIADLQVEDTYAAYAAKDGMAADGSQLLPAVITTDFEALSAVSYGLALQADGKMVAVGTTGDETISTIAGARYVAKESSDKATAEAKSGTLVGQTNVNITTLEPTNVTRTGAFTGGKIGSGLGTVTQRGVVFSIAPYPIYKEGSDSGESGGGGVGPTVTRVSPDTTLAAGTTTETLKVSTNVAANCKWSTSDASYSAMSNTFSQTGGTTHSETLTGLADGESYTYYIRCQDSDSGDINTSSTQVSFSVSESTTTMLLKKSSQLLGDFLVSDALAADDTTTSSGFLSTSSAVEFDEEGNTDDGAGIGTYSSILKNLKPGTTYYVRAYAQTDDGTYYGNTVEVRTADSCFIATAAFGTVYHPSVRVLRTFRDRYLAGSSMGDTFIRLYYQYSPPVAKIIEKNVLFRLIIRILLLPFIVVSWCMVQVGWAGLLLPLTFLAVTVYLFLMLKKQVWTQSRKAEI